ncbi:N-acetylmuramoyl-L-alanine amidase family protein [Clostridium chromiireducens]|uniref:Autolysin n=1 Tax=Clostridium chromiireducens TaxID=225345 RepID=A0A1V4IGQ8_9CLOT|nr:N-acetylmuramoyl-L-alanine amidase family protein [Clostridium chromiireducens]OPJ58727.1 autolysin [Clostridium chromiireducens]
MKNIFVKNLMIIVLIFLSIGCFGVFNELEVYGETNGWTNSNNSWRYYSGPSIQTGWCKDKGNWYYLDDNGMIKTGWIKSEGKWYYLDPRTGKMLTGWIEEKGKWHYLNSSGEMITGWLEYNGNLYYLNTSGVMVKDVYVGSYYLGPDGAWKEGSINKK